MLAEFGEERRSIVKLALRCRSQSAGAISLREDANFTNIPGVGLAGRTPRCLQHDRRRALAPVPITMQVARNFFLTRASGVAGYLRKANEEVLTFKIEATRLRI